MTTPEPAAEHPFEDAHFRRVDESDDARFYVDPRLVAHIDDDAIAALTAHYRTALSPGGRVLDLMSSWISHWPDDLLPSRAAGLGMNAEELRHNPALDDWVVHDLNRDPTLPYADASFDAVTIAVSVQYLTRPLDVFADIARVLSPGGVCVVSFSNRCFPTKAVALWQGLNDDGHVRQVGSYFHYTGVYDRIEAYDLSPAKGQSDPLYVVQAWTASASAGEPPPAQA